VPFAFGSLHAGISGNRRQHISKPWTTYSCGPRLRCAFGAAAIRGHWRDRRSRLTPARHCENAGAIASVPLDNNPPSP
jgi:hypothetical protein